MSGLDPNGDPPLPGTAEARARKCTCPDFDPELEKRGEPRWVAKECPLHGLAAFFRRFHDAEIAAGDVSDP